MVLFIINKKYLLVSLDEPHLTLTIIHLAGNTVISKSSKTTAYFNSCIFEHLTKSTTQTFMKLYLFNASSSEKL